MGHGGGSAVLGSPQVEHLPSWGMEHGKNRIYSPTRASPNFFNSQFPIPNAQCPLTTNN
ncbi:hypothetical protein [Tolypothrix sp. VBCCA 56010]|uniref:hypothetical protein n=1 Tax=Tolypothrix sp. VBCCA 56010 TaxID=3137731 RepID=UPI003D7E4DAB